MSFYIKEMTFICQIILIVQQSKYCLIQNQMYLIIDTLILKLTRKDSWVIAKYSCYYLMPQNSIQNLMLQKS